jgi:hypothetical protein
MRDANNKSLLPEKVGNDAEDLFGRKQDEDNILDNLEYIKIFLNEIKNVGLLKDAILVLSWGDDTTGPQVRVFDLTSESSQVTLEGDAISTPFSPVFEILLPRDDPNNPLSPASVIIAKDTDENKAGNQLDFNIAIEAKLDLNYKVEF